jgi:hypothetical protein
MEPTSAPNPERYRFNTDTNGNEPTITDTARQVQLPHPL